MSRIGKLSTYLTLVSAICATVTACSIIEKGDSSKPARSATAPPIKSYEAGDLVGIWVLNQQGSDTLVSFHADGSYARDAQGQLAIDPATYGIYSVDGSRLTFKVRHDECSTPGQYIWEINMPEDGLLTAKVIEDSTCYAATGIQSSWTRLSPNGKLELSPPPFTASEQGIPARAGNLQSVWYLAGSSTLISFAKDGTYTYDNQGTLDTDPIDTGTYQAAGSTLTLTSGGDSAACNAGNVLVLEDAKALYPGWWLIGRVVQDSCGRLQPGEVFLKAVSI